MSFSYDVSREGDYIMLQRCHGPFGVPCDQWSMTAQEAERVSKILTEAAKSMRKRAASQAQNSEKQS